MCNVTNDLMQQRSFSKRITTALILISTLYTHKLRAQRARSPQQACIRNIPQESSKFFIILQNKLINLNLCSAGADKFAALSSRPPLPLLLA